LFSGNLECRLGRCSMFNAQCLIQAPSAALSAEWADYRIGAAAAAPQWMDPVRRQLPGAKPLATARQGPLAAAGSGLWAALAGGRSLNKWRAASESWTSRLSVSRLPNSPSLRQTSNNRRSCCFASLPPLTLRTPLSLRYRLPFEPANPPETVAASPEPRSRLTPCHSRRPAVRSPVL
jgi:hypothetical protein